MDKNIFVTKAIFVEKDVVQNTPKILRRSKNSFFSKNSKKQIRKMIKELLFFSDAKKQKFKKYILGVV